MTDRRTASPLPRRDTRPSSLLEPPPELAEPEEWYPPESGSRIRLAPLPGLHRQDPLDSRQPGRWWMVLHVIFAAEVAVIAVALLGRLLAAWLGMP